MLGGLSRLGPCQRCGRCWPRGPSARHAAVEGSTAAAPQQTLKSGLSDGCKHVQLVSMCFSKAGRALQPPACWQAVARWAVMESPRSRNSPRPARPPCRYTDPATPAQVQKEDGGLPYTDLAGTVWHVLNASLATNLGSNTTWQQAWRAEFDNFLAWVARLMQLGGFSLLSWLRGSFCARGAWRVGAV